MLVLQEFLNTKKPAIVFEFGGALRIHACWITGMHVCVIFFRKGLVALSARLVTEAEASPNTIKPK